jgi:hypothetical protein
MSEPGGACTEPSPNVFSVAFLMAHYLVIAQRSTPQAEAQLFLETLCREHHDYAQSFLQGLIDDEGDPVIRVALVKLHDAQTFARRAS